LLIHVLIFHTVRRDFSGRSESSVRRRAQPQFVRTPSRRYTRRVVEGAQDGKLEGVINFKIIGNAL